MAAVLISVRPGSGFQGRDGQGTAGDTGKRDLDTDIGEDRSCHTATHRHAVDTGTSRHTDDQYASTQ